MPYQKASENGWRQSRFYEPDRDVPDKPWLMLAVARLGPDQQAPHYPLAAFTADCTSGTFLTSCAKALRYFSDPLNYLGTRAELSLAYDFYNQPGPPWPNEGPSRAGHPEFPFIATCLAIAVTREQTATNQNIGHWPLASVYHHFERALHRHMLVIDVSDPAKVRYGIYLHSSRLNRQVLWPDGSPSSRPLSVVDFITACAFVNERLYGGSVDEFTDEFKKASAITSRWKVMDVPTLHFGWPFKSSQKPLPPPSLRDQVFRTLVRGAAEMEDVDISVFEHVRAIPNFQNELRRYLIKHSANLGDHQPIAQLIALTVEGQEQLDLTPFNNLSANSISIVLGNRLSDTPIRAISLCTDTLKSSPSEVLEVLARFPTIQNLYFAKHPRQGDQLRSTELFVEMLKMPSSMTKKHILVADFLSTPLRSARHYGPIPIPSYQIPVDIFPVQHMFVRHQTYGLGRERFWPNYFPMGNLMLQPERFAAGFIQYILRSVQPGSTGVEASEKLFDFCSAPPALNGMNNDYQISQIPLESSAVPLRPGTSRRGEHVGDCWPLVRTLEPNSWIVLVSLHHNRITRDLESWTTRAHHATNWARYAFARMKPRVEVARPPVQLPALDKIEVVGLREFLRITSPETDLGLVDVRLKELEEKAAIPRQQPLPSGVKRLSVMEREEAVGILRDFLNNVEMVKKNLWAFMKENDGELSSTWALAKEYGIVCG
ncbi:hypothetical protein QC763_402400 [Podospora pseudopauciseta]|uniref:Uncharacterized protein n=1 Tax=Podospora pseudopauciseta TaxID=2093780 RepID=A0ABR0HCA2_9PEZI|nr:hypothetical protein QC763_402400 [Podospora pseudopauciseta]